MADVTKQKAGNLLKEPLYDVQWFNTPWQAQSGGGQLGQPQQTYMYNPNTGQRIPYSDWQQINALKLEERKTYEMKQKGLNPDGSPIRPDQISAVDEQGNLKDNFRVNLTQIDPTKLEGYQMLRALATTPAGQQTDIAKAQNALAAQQRNENMDRVGTQAQGAYSGALNQLAMRGGAGSGARTSLAKQNLRDTLLGRQGVSRDYSTNLLKIDSEDQNRKVGFIKDFGNAEGQLSQYNNDIGNRNQTLNMQNQLAGVTDYNKFLMDAYTTENDKWAAGRQAEATRNSGGGGGGGCCFIFLEARYGNGVMDAVVRRYRDEHITARNARGYYKLSEVVVPLMRKSRVFKRLVRLTLTDPLVMYAKAYYGKGSKLGYVFAPLKNFWLKVFDYLGQDHKFIRENGEVI